MPTLAINRHPPEHAATAPPERGKGRPPRSRPGTAPSGQAVVHKELEMILMRQVADCLATPIFIVSVEGTLVFYNEPAEVLLGLRFEETGELTVSQWATAFVPTDAQGQPLPPDQLPLVIALQQRRPAHAQFWIRGMDQIARQIQVTAFPLLGRANRFLGAVAIFWEVSKP